MMKTVFTDTIQYSDNIKYNNHPDNIGNISCEHTRFFEELEKVAKEMYRILKPSKYIAWLIGDQAKKYNFYLRGFKYLIIMKKVT